jgi:hypothetical protein
MGVLLRLGKPIRGYGSIPISSIRKLEPCTGKKGLLFPNGLMYPVSFGRARYYMRKIYRFLVDTKMQLQAGETYRHDEMLGSVQLRVQVIILRVVSKGHIATARCSARAASWCS